MIDLITELTELLVQDNVLLFVGSALQDGQDREPFIKQIAEALAQRIGYEHSNRSLSAVARDFEALHGRNDLIRALREEFAKLPRQPTPIHQLIADALWPTTKVITTRFDQILEEALEQFKKNYVVIVRDTDVPFFDESKIMLIKMQGDINQPESLIITEDDIDAFISKLPALSDVIRAFFATKTLIFLGYDLNSDLFKRFFRQVNRNVSVFSRTAYAIVPEPLDKVETSYWQRRNVKICQRDPSAFLEELAQAVKAAIPPPPPPPPPLPTLPPRPYKGLQHFTTDDVLIFAGRLEESLRLTNRILGRRLTVLYGESGSGKTSLMLAGVGPYLQPHEALFAVVEPVPDVQLPTLIRRRLAQTAQMAGLPQLKTAPFPFRLRTWQHTLNAPVVLVIDPFESFFLLYDAPARQATLELINEWLNDRSLNLRIVLVVREDFMGRVQALEAELPGLLDAPFRLERLSREMARAAIEEPASRFKVTWEPALIKRLLDELYEGANGGIAPPPLQMVCHYLYRFVVEYGGERQITLAQFQKIGGTEGILGSYLDRSLLELPAKQEPMAKELLKALVSSSGSKQRLSLSYLAHITNSEPAEANTILDRLHEQQLVRRYEIETEESAPTVHGATAISQLEYELTHHFLAMHIARWLDETFWVVQKAREIIRQALPEWQRHDILLSPGKLRQVAAQRERLRFFQQEAEMLYAAAVTYDNQPEQWAAQLPLLARRDLLLKLLHHTEPAARALAPRHLATVQSAAVASALAQAYLTDAESEVRDAALQALIDASGTPSNMARVAISRLVAALNDPATEKVARAGLVRLRERHAHIHNLLPAERRAKFQREVWKVRWRRNQERILAATLQGMQGGFWGLGLGMGTFLGLYTVKDLHVLPRLRLGLIYSGLSWAGVMGTLAVGGGALVGVILDSLQDRVRPLRTWIVKSGVTAIGFSAGLVIMSWTSPGTPTTLRTALAGMIISLGVAGTATLPIKLAWPMRLLFTALVGMTMFVLVGWLGLFFDQSYRWLLLMGATSGIGFFFGLNPDLLRTLWRLRVE